MLTIEQLFRLALFGNATDGDQVELYMIIEYTLHMYKKLLAADFVDELIRVKNGMSSSVKDEGSVRLVVETKNFVFLTKIDKITIAKLLAHFNPSYLYRTLGAKQNISFAAKLFYEKGISVLELFTDTRCIEPVISDTNIVYTKELDDYLPSESILEIARCLVAHRKTIGFVGPNYLGIVDKKDVINTTVQGITYFDSETVHYRKEINTDQLLELHGMFKSNVSPYFFSKVKSIKDGSDTTVVLAREAAGQPPGTKLIDFLGSGSFREFRVLVKLYGENIVTQFINYDSFSLTNFLDCLETKPDFCTSWKPTDICPGYYCKYYGKQIEWETKCSNLKPCVYCNPKEYKERQQFEQYKYRKMEEAFDKY